jgi:hypothetical protein
MRNMWKEGGERRGWVEWMRNRNRNNSQTVAMISEEVEKLRGRWGLAEHERTREEGGNDKAIYHRFNQSSGAGRERERGRGEGRERLSIQQRIGKRTIESQLKPLLKLFKEDASEDDRWDDSKPCCPIID